MSVRFLGPIFLHGHSDIETYHFFQSSVIKAYWLPVPKPDTGVRWRSSHQEVHASCFSNSYYVACRRHVKENADHKLDALTGNRTQVIRRQIYTLFCSATAVLLHATTSLLTMTQSIAYINRSWLQYRLLLWTILNKWLSIFSVKMLQQIEQDGQTTTV